MPLFIGPQLPEIVPTLRSVMGRRTGVKEREREKERASYPRKIITLYDKGFPLFDAASLLIPSLSVK